MNTIKQYSIKPMSVEQKDLMISDIINIFNHSDQIRAKLYDYKQFGQKVEKILDKYIFYYDD
jgi:hypothetical protein